MPRASTGNIGSTVSTKYFVSIGATRKIVLGGLELY